MSKIDRVQIVSHATDSADAVTTARQDIARLAGELFEGAGVAPLQAGVLSGAQPIFRSAVYYDGARPVGFALVVVDRVEHAGQTVRAARAITGLHPEYRGGQRSMPFFLGVGLDLVLQGGQEPLWGFVPSVHVSSYRLVAQHVPGMVPHPARPVTGAQQGWIDAMAERFHCERRAGDHPLVCRRAMAVRGARIASPVLRDSDELDRFFFRVNPDFDKGACVMLLFPITLGGMLGAALRFSAHCALRRVQRALRSAAAFRLPGVAALGGLFR